jgi:hypothetical protein
VFELRKHATPRGNRFSRADGIVDGAGPGDRPSRTAKLGHRDARRYADRNLDGARVRRHLRRHVRRFGSG